MKLTDRQIGYTTLAAIVLACAVLAVQMYRKNAEGVQIAQVLFPEVGALQPQDAVVERGVRIGKVHSIRYSTEHGQAVVSVEFDTPLKFRQGTQFINTNYSLMGQRLVTIIPSSKGDLLDLHHPQQGVFEPGIAEAMHLMEFVVHTVDTLKEAVRLLASGDKDNAPLTAKINQMVGRTEGLVTSIHTTLDRQGPRLEQGLRRANTLARMGLQQADTIQTAVLTTARASTQTIHAVDSSMTGLQQQLLLLHADLDSLMLSGTYRSLLEERKLFDRVVELNRGVQAVLRALRTDEGAGFAGDGWILWKKTNWNVLGATAREKRVRTKPEAGNHQPSPTNP